MAVLWGAIDRGRRQAYLGARVKLGYRCTVTRGYVQLPSTRTDYEYIELQAGLDKIPEEAPSKVEPKMDRASSLRHHRPGRIPDPARPLSLPVGAIPILATAPSWSVP